MASGGAGFDASDENAIELRLGKLQDSSCISNAVVLNFIELAKAQYDNQKAQFPPVMDSVLSYTREVTADTFPRASDDVTKLDSLHKDLDALKFLPDSGDDKGDGFEQADKLHPFEVSALINLNPTDVNEMLELVPSLDRLNAEDQNKVFTVLREGIDS